MPSASTALGNARPACSLAQGNADRARSHTGLHIRVASPVLVPPSACVPSRRRHSGHGHVARITRRKNCNPRGEAVDGRFPAGGFLSAWWRSQPRWQSYSRGTNRNLQRHGAEATRPPAHRQQGRQHLARTAKPLQE
ncbi:hypothetical protein PHYPSEUDO_010517 [Phytophthora pseudosyringae]|uniref:Uncharacterized protein n=1 Tax=Phytophthora pseudosyringae TaxID=221518 RepID=A0A8T1WCL7_9STRA|nr:hypothetical protein PHYPSEUDO_010517 [Phytophthora pseudosyringae]